MLDGALAGRDRVAVIGGGVIGLSLACYYLSEALLPERSGRRRGRHQAPYRRFQDILGNAGCVWRTH